MAECVSKWIRKNRKKFPFYSNIYSFDMAVLLSAIRKNVYIVAELECDVDFNITRVLYLSYRFTISSAKVYNSFRLYFTCKFINIICLSLEYFNFYSKHPLYNPRLPFLRSHMELLIKFQSIRPPNSIRNSSDFSFNYKFVLINR
jgi:hypothetical protein